MAVLHVSLPAPPLLLLLLWFLLLPVALLAWRLAHHHHFADPMGAATHHPIAHVLTYLPTRENDSCGGIPFRVPAAEIYRTVVVRLTLIKLLPRVVTEDVSAC
eukprot:GHVU01110708.1.p1 GENE.GHVU01110708.1~~GHVU01110708.1.p1  ORF type:complete len:112 (+),score=11.06 GHVU01110708.1:28-336(+)